MQGAMGELDQRLPSIRKTFSNNSSNIVGVLRKGLPFHGSRSYREINMQNESSQMGGHEVTGRQNWFFLQENKGSRSHKSASQSSFLDTSALPDLFWPKDLTNFSGPKNPKRIPDYAIF